MAAQAAIHDKPQLARCLRPKTHLLIWLGLRRWHQTSGWLPWMAAAAPRAHPHDAAMTRSPGDFALHWLRHRVPSAIPSIWAGPGCIGPRAGLPNDIRYLWYRQAAPV